MIADEKFRRVMIEILALASPDKSAQPDLVPSSDIEKLSAIVRIAKRNLAALNANEPTHE